MLYVSPQRFNLFINQWFFFNLLWQENKKTNWFCARCTLFLVSKFSLKCCVSEVFSSLMEGCCFYHAELYLRWLLVIHTVCSSLFPGSAVISADRFLWYILFCSFWAFLRLLFMVFISLEFLWLALFFSLPVWWQCLIQATWWTIWRCWGCCLSLSSLSFGYASSSFSQILYFLYFSFPNSLSRLRKKWCTVRVKRCISNTSYLIFFVPPFKFL